MFEDTFVVAHYPKNGVRELHTVGPGQVFDMREGDVKTAWQAWHVGQKQELSDKEKAWAFVTHAEKLTGNPVGIMKATEMGMPFDIADHLLKPPPAQTVS